MLSQSLWHCMRDLTTQPSAEGGWSTPPRNGHDRIRTKGNGLSHRITKSSLATNGRTPTARCCSAASCMETGQTTATPSLSCRVPPGEWCRPTARGTGKPGSTRLGPLAFRKPRRQGSGRHTAPWPLGRVQMGWSATLTTRMLSRHTRSRSALPWPPEGCTRVGSGRRGRYLGTSTCTRC